MTQDEETATLHIALEEVFRGDTVVISVNSESVYRKGDVKTNFSVGLADTLEVMVPKGDVTVTFELPLRNLSKTVDFHVSEPVYLRVRVVQDVIEVERSSWQTSYY